MGNNRVWILSLLLACACEPLLAQPPAKGRYQVRITTNAPGASLSASSPSITVMLEGPLELTPEVAAVVSNATMTNVATGVVYPMSSPDAPPEATFHGGTSKTYTATGLGAATYQFGFDLATWGPSVDTGQFVDRQGHLTQQIQVVP